MKTKFTEFNENIKSPVYPKDYFMMQDMRHIENPELWIKAIKIATDNGKKQASFGTVTKIYNNLDNKLDKVPDDWVSVSYTHFKQLYDLNSRLSVNDRKFYKSILATLKKYGKVSPLQLIYLRKLG